MKTRCCKSFKRKGKPCKKCPKFANATSKDAKKRRKSKKQAS